MSSFWHPHLGQVGAQESDRVTLNAGSAIHSGRGRAEVDELLQRLFAIERNCHLPGAGPAGLLIQTDRLLEVGGHVENRPKAPGKAGLCGLSEKGTAVRALDATLKAPKALSIDTRVSLARNQSDWRMTSVAYSVARLCRGRFFHVSTSISVDTARSSRN